MNNRNNFFKPPPFGGPFKHKSPHLYSAGILPYQVDDNKQVYILMGKDNDGAWSDFGGKCEPEDHNNIQETAAREFYEESLGSVLNLTTTRNMLKNKKNYKLINSESFGGKTYYMFMLRVPMVPTDTNDRFKRTCEYLRYMKADYKYLEKVAISWVSLETILALLDQNERNEKQMGWPLRKVFRRTLVNHRDVLYKLKNDSMYK